MLLTAVLLTCCAAAPTVLGDEVQRKRVVNDAIMVSYKRDDNLTGILFPQRCAERLLQLLLLLLLQ